MVHFFLLIGLLYLPPILREHYTIIRPECKVFRGFLPRIFTNKHEVFSDRIYGMIRIPGVEGAKGRIQNSEVRSQNVGGRPAACVLSDGGDLY